MARTARINDDLIAKVVGYLRTGTTRKNAYEMAGINHATFNRWMLKYAHFAQAVVGAENAWQLDLERTITVSARGSVGPDGVFVPGNTADAKWLLERRRREDYGANIKLDLDREIAEIFAQLADSSEAPATGGRAQRVEPSPDEDAEPAGDRPIDTSGE